MFHRMRMRMRYYAVVFILAWSPHYTMAWYRIYCTVKIQIND